MNIHILITFSHRRFVYIHTFFCSKIMCGCRLLTYLYDIQYISYECRLHYSHIAPPAPIEAKFCTHPQARYAPQPIRAATPVLSYPVCLYNAAAIIYKHILLGENSFDLIRTRAHEKIQVNFFCAPNCYIYCILLGKM